MKKLFYVIVLAIIAFAFTGCSKNEMSGSILGTWEEYRSCRQDFLESHFDDEIIEQKWRRQWTFHDDGTCEVFGLSWSHDGTYETEYFTYEISGNVLTIEEDLYIIEKLTKKELVITNEMDFYLNSKHYHWKDFEYFNRIK